MILPTTIKKISRQFHRKLLSSILVINTTIPAIFDNSEINSINYLNCSCHNFLHFYIPRITYFYAFIFADSELTIKNYQI